MERSDGNFHSKTGIPERAEKAMRFLTSCYQMDLEKTVNGALFNVKYDEMVLVRDIEF